MFKIFKKYIIINIFFILQKYIIVIILYKLFYIIFQKKKINYV